MKPATPESLHRMRSRLKHAILHLANQKLPEPEPAWWSDLPTGTRVDVPAFGRDVVTLSTLDNARTDLTGYWSMILSSGPVCGFFDPLSGVFHPDLGPAFGLLQPRAETCYLRTGLPLSRRLWGIIPTLYL